MNGIKLIAAEREEQITKHKYDREHDAEHTGSQILGAANAIINRNPNWFPKDWSIEHYNNIMRKSRVGQLVVSAALIAAEIDRILAIDQDKLYQLSKNNE